MLKRCQLLLLNLQLFSETEKSTEEREITGYTEPDRSAMAEVLDSVLGLGPSLDLGSNETDLNVTTIANQTYFAPYEVPVEIVVLLSLFYGAISLVAVLGNLKLPKFKHLVTKIKAFSYQKLCF